MTFEVARVAEMLRTGKKHQGLSDARIADEIERLTGSRPGPMWASRRLHGSVPLLKISPDLCALADIMGLNLIDVIMAVVGDEPVTTGHAYDWWQRNEDEHRAEVEREQAEAAELFAAERVGAE